MTAIIEMFFREERKKLTGYLDAFDGKLWKS